MSDPIAVVLVILLLSVFFLIRTVVRTAKIHVKGAIGEAKITHILRRLPKDEYHIFHDITLETKFGSSQIDHIAVSRNGIYVIETKNYKGWIHGGERSEYWTQSIYRHKSTFRNPVKQNWSHVIALKELLSGIGRIEYHPIVVFAGSATLKNVYSKLPVIYSDQLISQIMSTQATYPLSADELQEILRRLRDPQVRPLPPPDLNQSGKYGQRKESTDECPKCAGPLVLRNGRFGQFYGCSSYPLCKYTRNL